MSSVATGQVYTSLLFLICHPCREVLPRSIAEKCRRDSKAWLGGAHRVRFALVGKRLRLVAACQDKYVYFFNIPGSVPVPPEEAFQSVPPRPAAAPPQGSQVAAADLRELPHGAVPPPTGPPQPSGSGDPVRDVLDEASAQLSIRAVSGTQGLFAVPRNPCLPWRL